MSNNWDTIYDMNSQWLIETNDRPELLGRSTTLAEVGAVAELSGGCGGGCGGCGGCSGCNIAGSPPLSLADRAELEHEEK